MILCPHPHKLKHTKPRLLFMFQQLWKVLTVLSCQIPTQCWNALAWTCGDCHCVSASVFSSPLGFRGVRGTDGCKGLKIQAKITDVIRAFVDGVGDSVGFTIIARVVGVLQVGVVVVNRSIRIRIFGEDATDLCRETQLGNYDIS